ncbi:hypothetical protein F441_01226 [Phytophthora nicotianae CJ01A1]|uniref:DDE Tnp4 domain-containing protein n=1 Tax=Phytophthora nicotianae CJ01A1 TaxID=1317063 RepID=W2XSW8_PHYNI|nr:hypothetical protein F441_01226 [Phytophthora nicotianae CJ01A1]
MVLHIIQEMTSTLLVNPGRIVTLFPMLQRSAWCSTISVLSTADIRRDVVSVLAVFGVFGANSFGDYAGMISLRHPLLTKGFFFVDGVNIPVAESEFDDIQNAYYNGWACSHYCSNVLAFAPDGSTIRATSIPSRLVHVQQAAKLFLQRRKVSLRAIKLIHVVLVVVQHNLPFVCSSWENYTADL